MLSHTITLHYNRGKQGERERARVKTEHADVGILWHVLLSSSIHQLLCPCRPGLRQWAGCVAAEKLDDALVVEGVGAWHGPELVLGIEILRHTASFVTYGRPGPTWRRACWLLA
jgi:hypothetical protein